MSFRKKGSPYYHYDFQQNGVRYAGSTHCTSKRDGDRVEAEAKRKAALGEKTKPHITVDDAFGTWWSNKGQFLKSAKTTKGQLANLMAGLGAKSRLADIGFADLDDYIARRRAKVANATVNRETEWARVVWRYTAMRGFETGDPIDWGKLMLSEPKERIRELSADEERRLFEQLPPDLAAVAEFAMLSGQRRTAVITLLWDKVDFHARQATIRLKDEDDAWHNFPLTPRMIAILANRPKGCAQVFTYECERPGPARKDRVARQKGERYPLSKQGWARKWRKALADAGIEDFRFHDLRHTALTRIVRATGNLKVAQKLAGHTTIATTARYAHATENDVLNAMNAAQSGNSPAQILAVENSSTKKVA